MSEHNYIYFLCVSHAKRDVIKIGITRNVDERLREHAKPKHGQTFQTQVLCVVRGNRHAETAIQAYFKADKLDNEKETFHATPAVLGYIRWMKNQFYVWVPDAECGRYQDVGGVEESSWLPKPERTTPEPPKRLFPAFLGLEPRQITPDDFYTNKKIIEPARATMGGIDLDPASHAIANKVVQAERFYSIGDDGLARQWSGRVWLNPPFSDWSRWSKKLEKEWTSGRVEAMVVLAATRTISAQYFKPVHEHSAAVCVFYGRIPFWGDLATTPDEGHVVFYFGQDVAAFIKHHSELGMCYVKPEGKKP